MMMMIMTMVHLPAQVLRLMMRATMQQMTSQVNQMQNPLTMSHLRKAVLEGQVAAAAAEAAANLAATAPSQNKMGRQMQMEMIESPQLAVETAAGVLLQQAGVQKQA
jgi:hypothetical protein